MSFPNEYRSINLLSEEKIKKFVLSNFSLENSKLSNIKFKDTDKQRAVYKVENTNGTYCLKKVYFKKDDLLFIYSAIEWFHRYGIKVPKILPTNKKERFVEYDNMLFILTPWIDGIKCDYDNDEHIYTSSLNLAKMHRVTENFTPIKGSKSRFAFDDLFLSQKKHFEQLLVCSNLAFKYNDKFSKLFLDNFQNNLALAQISLEFTSSLNMNNLYKSVCHSDYVNKNLIFDEEKSIWVIDFDKCTMDYAVHDLSYYLRRLLKRENTIWDTNLLKHSLDIYDSERPLNKDEYKYIFCYLSFPQKYWKISKDYYNNINKCNKASFFTLLTKACESTDEQLHFSYEFKKYIEEKFN